MQGILGQIGQGEVERRAQVEAVFCTLYAQTLRLACVLLRKTAAPGPTTGPSSTRQSAASESPGTQWADFCNRA